VNLSNPPANVVADTSVEVTGGVYAFAPGVSGLEQLAPGA
jgi:hypothetical protein